MTRPLLAHRGWSWGGCPLVARAIACGVCRNGGARYVDAASYLELTAAPFLFVYGTLKRGHANNRLLGGARFVATDRAPGFATSVFAPLATPHAGSMLEGEVWEGVDEATWRRLDELEWAYARERVRTEGGRDAVIYVITGPVPGPVTNRWPFTREREQP